MVDEQEMAHDTAAEIALVDEKLVVAAVQAPEYRLEDLLPCITDENIHAEIGTGPPIGKESW